ncbi:transglycosylase [Bdellovibrio bacteriovorus]|uniref:Transglycosylase n=1 Tax=Bdellovibrio bacteriovorus TaxID=959 RepID=A0A150WE90_BDEBC|nr:GlsB/YeaQ/YmgE family stress response membrane protein [Bdellovibrio bacteriovorus]KYG61118.1 transglycosylase [Bdellovibrio bacteriovorus]
MLSSILLGFAVGIAAKILLPGKAPGGWVITCLLGIAGGAVAHLLGTSAGYYRDYEPLGFAAAIVGAMFILFLYRVLVRRTT